jgi:hypothetical protein
MFTHAGLNFQGIEIIGNNNEFAIMLIEGKINEE